MTGGGKVERCHATPLRPWCLPARAPTQGVSTLKIGGMQPRNSPTRRDPLASQRPGISRFTASVPVKASTNIELAGHSEPRRVQRRSTTKKKKKEKDKAGRLAKRLAYIATMAN